MQDGAKSKLKVLFVGGFRDTAADGVPGGQNYACRTLLNSPLSERVQWVLLDTSQESLPLPPLSRRALLAAPSTVAVRVVVTRGRPRIVILFSSAGLSFLEKGLMC